MEEEGPKTLVGKGEHRRLDGSGAQERESRRRDVPASQGTVDLWPGKHPLRTDGTSHLEESLELLTSDVFETGAEQWVSPSVLEADSLPAQTVGFQHRTFRVLAEGKLEWGEPVEDCHYELLSVLGKGGMGLVCLARHRALGRDVALKLVRDSASPEKLAAFIREARITGSLEHPNVVPVYDLATDDSGQVFFTMKRLSGASWEDLLCPDRVLNSVTRARLQERQGCQV